MKDWFKVNFKVFKKPYSLRDGEYVHFVYIVLKMVAYLLINLVDDFNNRKMICYETLSYR